MTNNPTNPRIGLDRLSLAVAQSSMPTGERGEQTERGSTMAVTFGLGKETLDIVKLARLLSKPVKAASPEGEVNEAAERAAFEAHIGMTYGFEASKVYLARTPGGSYVPSVTKWAWDTWMASAKGGGWRPPPPERAEVVAPPRSETKPSAIKDSLTTEADPRDERIAAWGSREHVNAVGAFLVSRCGVPVDQAGGRAIELVEAAALTAKEALP